MEPEGDGKGGPAVERPAPWWCVHRGAVSAIQAYRPGPRTLPHKLLHM